MKEATRPEGNPEHGVRAAVAYCSRPEHLRRTLTIALIVGIVLMLASIPFFSEYFDRRPEVANPHVLSDESPPLMPGEPTG